MDKVRAYSLGLGQLNVSTVACIVSAIHEANITAANVSVGSIEPPTLSGFVSPGMDTLFSDLGERRSADSPWTAVHCHMSRLQCSSD